MSRDVNPWPDNPMGHGAIDCRHRFQWTFPIVFSPHDPDLLYTCSQYLLKTTNGGETWKVISPDLTRNDPSRLGSSGGPITKDNTCVEYYGTIFTVAESPLVPGLIWTGSDDGLVHLSRDGGASWRNITPPGMPEWGLCSMIEASPHHPGTAWLAVDNHENDDFTPYVFVTRDFGTTWTKITDYLPDDTFVRVVREDPVRPDLLYAGTEMGVFVSYLGGEDWQPLQFNLPLVPIHDLVIKDDDLIAATHGRSFWVLDDITPIRQIADMPMDRRIVFFEPKDAYRIQWGGGGGYGRGGGSSGPVGENPPSGVVLTWGLTEDVESVKFEIIDPAGEVFMTLASGGAPGQGRGRGSAIPTTAGVHRTSAWLQYPGFRGFEGMITWAARSRPIPAPPGEYTVRMTVLSGGRAEAFEHTFRWLADPRSGSSDADLQAQFDLARRITERTNEANDAVWTIRELKRLIAEAASATGNRTLERAAEELTASLSGPEAEIYQVRNRSGQDPLNFPIRLNDKIGGLLGVVLSGDYRPTDQCYEVFADLSAQLQVQLDALARIYDTDLAAFNARLRRLGRPEIAVPVRPEEDR